MTTPGIPSAARWVMASLSSEAQADEPGIAPFVVSLLRGRGITDPLDAQRFLRPQLKNLSDPFALPNMGQAVDRILRALDRGERIVLWGDYDVDGVASLAMFSRVLRVFGCAPFTFLPTRMDEGYGLSPEAVNRCLTTLNPGLLIALDCGTSSVAEIDELRARGVDVIVIDHHECQAPLPRAVALVNPKLGEDFRYLCTAGLVFKLCHALLKRHPLENLDLREYLDLVALGTVADMAPLVLENRILVRKGLGQLERTRWAGVRALLEIAGVAAPMRPSDIGFRLGPRLNAAGRLGTAEDALELLSTDDAARAQQLAASLDAQNRDRQAVERSIAADAEKQLKGSFDSSRDFAIVVGATGWHQGVLGIVASRLAKNHHRPALVIGFDDAGAGRGSGRSIAGLSLVNALGHCGHFLDKFGGHEMAAGFAISRGRFEEFRLAFLDCARSLLTEDDLLPRLRLDAELPLDIVDFDFLLHHEQLQPFGIGNPQPVFLARGVAPASEPRILKEKHLLFSLRQNGRIHSAIYFDGARFALPPLPWDAAFHVERNEYGDRISVQIQILALREAE